MMPEVSVNELEDVKGEVIGHFRGNSVIAFWGRYPQDQALPWRCGVIIEGHGTIIEKEHLLPHSPKNRIVAFWVAVSYEDLAREIARKAAQRFLKSLPEEWQAEAEDLPPGDQDHEKVTEKIVKAWDKWGAPSVARAPSGHYVASFEGPGGAFSVEASTKREAYQKARREWLKRILAGE